MEPINRHPLEAITGKSGLSMLELLIPFVDYSLKLPLALFIKYYEIRMILQAFRTMESTRQLGLHHPTNNPMDLLCALTGISPDVLKLLQTFSESSALQSNTDLFSGLSQMNGMNLADLLKNLQPGSVPSGFGNSGTDPTSFSPEFTDTAHSPFAGSGQPVPETGEGVSSFPEFPEDFPGDMGKTTSPESPSGDSFEENIQKILAEYDLQQAQQL